MSVKDYLSAFKKESEEHPTLPESEIKQVVKDHAKVDPIEEILRDYTPEQIAQALALAIGA